MKYIDSLFFASGAATQSGLNPIDLNKTTVYQQLVMYFVACVCNPIWIHSFVVFVRLYWFEKRFHDIVEEAREQRRSKARSRTRSEAREGADLEVGKHGVGNKKITVMRDHPANGPVAGNDKIALGEMSRNAMKEEEEEEEAESSSSSDDRVLQWKEALGRHNSDQAENGHYEPPGSGHQREIMFADEVQREDTDDSSSHLPQRLSTDQHIAFLESQRKHDKGALRIPGPRGFERGEMPRPLDADGQDDHQGSATKTEAEGDGANLNEPGNEEINLDDHPAKRGITFNEPDHPEHHPIRDEPTYTSHSRSLTLQSLSKRRSETLSLFSGLRHRTRSIRESSSFSRARSEERDPMPYLSWQATVGRNSLFIDLTEEQREELGGIEYRALKTLAVILVIYFLGFHLFGIISLLPWIMRSGTYGSIVTGDGVGRPWWAIFTSASCFNDLGYALTPDSFNSFENAVWPLLLGAFLIIIGNTGFPCMLRFIIWLTSLAVPRNSGLWEELRFLLDHPRRCFTLLFPSSATWWLFGVLVLLNGIDLIFFIILNTNNPVVTTLSPGIRVLDGLFQAASTRTAGFSVVSLAALHPGIQVSYLIMMYISVFPIAISMRKTNVYEEKSLGIYPGQSEPGNEEDANQQSYLGAHLRRQLSFDLWYVFLGMFIISIVEGGRLANTNEYAFTLFSVLFEIVSAYGTVGLSLGYPGINASFSAEFAVISKLVIIAMEIRGRHRGLPYALDRAILLPSESLHKNEEDAAQRATRRTSMLGPGLDGLRPTVEHAERQNAALRNGASSMRDRSNSRSRFSPMNYGPDTPGLSKLISGALSAGPTIARKYD
ncbi:MAG: low affinity potassium transporter [Bathelium mastoideum]|nr:MAG: low affinity potassium transporter [Bathelium mastoideum]